MTRQQSINASCAFAAAHKLKLFKGLHVEEFTFVNDSAVLRMDWAGRIFIIGGKNTHFKVGEETFKTEEEAFAAINAAPQAVEQFMLSDTNIKIEWFYSTIRLHMGSEVKTFIRGGWADETFDECMWYLEKMYGSAALKLALLEKVMSTPSLWVNVDTVIDFVLDNKIDIDNPESELNFIEAGYYNADTLTQYDLNIIGYIVLKNGNGLFSMRELRNLIK